MLKSDDVYAVARARALMQVYDETWSVRWKTEFEILGAEIEFRFPLLNPETEAPSRSFDEAGKIDVLARRKSSGRKLVVEHKTTSDSVDPASEYWDRLRLDTQISKYYLATARHGEPVDSVLYDVMSKPGQRPCKVPTLDENGFKIVLDPNGNRVFTKGGKPRESADNEKGWLVQGRQETPAEFETRLLTVQRAAPLEYFAQREAPRTNSDILEYMADAWASAQQILYFRSKNLWPRNPDACQHCEMFPLCSGRASVDGIRFRAQSVVHRELKIQDGESGRQLLTNSRLKALRKCARYHQLRYEQGIERVDEDKEALTFGALIHTGLEAYFNSIKNNNTPQ